MEMLRIRQDWQQLQALTPLIQAVNEQIVANSQEARYVDAARLLIQLPGINALSAMTLIAAIGDITRFASASQLSRYSLRGASTNNEYASSAAASRPKTVAHCPRLAAPASSKGVYLRKVAVSSTMGIGVRVDQLSLSEQA